MGNRPFTLYWSNLKLFEECPQSFLWGRGWGAIDVGGGPGRGKPKPLKKSEHHAVLGVAIQYVIEQFYNNELWRLLAPVTLRDRLLEMCAEALKIELAHRYIDFRMAPTRDEMLANIREGVMGYMRTLKAHRLLGPYARAEVDLVGFVNKYTPIGGRADMIIRRDDTGVTILDGKNSKRQKDGTTYTDPDQLRWYALLFHLCHRQDPNRLGFVFYRYPQGTPILDKEGKPTGEVEPGVEWVPFTRDDLKGLAARALEARKGMDKEQFEARPSPKTCRFCDYDTACPPRQAQKAENRRSRAGDDILNGVTGFTIL